MGLFLSASGVLSPDAEAIRDVISAYAASNDGTFDFRAGTTDDRNIGVMQATQSTTTVLYPDGFTNWDDLSKFLSVELARPVFSFHIHDGDLWMFIAFKDGDEGACFNPISDYWQEIDDDERRRWAGNAPSVASLVGDVDPASIERYFVPWTEEVLATEKKAYADDEFAIGSAWQLVDFMRRLGFVYPLDDGGTPTGETYYLKIGRPRRAPAIADAQSPEPKPSFSQKNSPAKSWWKFW